MSTFSTEINIQSPIEQVWDTLADIGNIDRWNPGVIESYVTSNHPPGPGASRHCRLGGKNYLDETVVAWEPGRRLTMRITNTNLPLWADICFTLHPGQNGTLVTVSPEYTVKYGLLGQLIDRFYVRNSYERGMKDLLAGLKQYVESNGA